MASDGRNTAAAAINAAISSADHRYTPPEERRWKVYWARYWCFKSHKREKRIVPAARSEGASGSARGWPAAQLGLVPPSSPASFVNSTVQSPASFTLSLSAVSASMCSPGPPNTMFTIGPYAHETQLVSPPGFSTFTTEPSTAPFTPPPELAHLTTPSSPDVPYAIVSSFEANSSVRETISPLSTSTLASPCDTPVSYRRTSSQYYLGSPVGRLISPTLGYFSSEVTSDENHPVQLSASVGQTVSSFPTFDPFASPSFDGAPFAAFILPCDESSKFDDPSSIVLVQHDSNQNHGKSSTCEKGGGPFLERKAELDFRHGQGNDPLGMSLETCDRDWRNTDEGALQSDGGSTVISASGDHPCIKKGEKLHKLFAYERNEMIFSQHAENLGGTFTAYNEDGCFEPSARKGGQANEGECASRIEATTTEVLGQSPGTSVDLLQEVEMRPVIFELDELS